MKTIQELILAVQDRISLPLDDDDRWSTTALVNAFNAALDDKLTPDLVANASNYLIQRQVFSLGSNYPLGAIPIPNRAVGRTLREVKYLPSGKTKPIEEINCIAISLDEKDKYVNDPTFYGTLAPFVYIENDSLMFVGGDTTGSIVMYYNLEPSTIENVTGKYATITAITWVGATTSTITTATPATTWDSHFANSTTKYVDIYRKSTGTLLLPNIKLTRNTNTYTINTSVTQDLITQLKSNQDGNFTDTALPYELLLIPSGTCEFSTIPYEYDQLLVLYVCERVLESLGDTEGLQVTMTKIKETRESIERISQVRLQGEDTRLKDRRSVSNVKNKSIQELILDVYDRLNKPIEDDPRWTTNALIRLFNNVVTDKIAPDLVSEGSNYLIHREVLPLTISGAVVYPLNSIPLPKRAVGRALREVKYLPEGKTKIEEELNCPAISLDEKDMYGNESEFYGSSIPYVFFENDYLRIVGGDTKGSIVLYYNLEPSTFKNTVNQFVNITNWSGSTITASAATTAWTSYIASGSSKFVDIYKVSTGAILKANVRVARSTDTYTITGLTTDEITQLKTNQAGGFPVSAPFDSELMLVPAGECEFSTLPYEYDQLLVLYVCERISEAMGDTAALQTITAKIKETRDSISRVMGNRLQGERRRLTDRRSIARIQRGQKWTRNYNKNYT